VNPQGTFFDYIGVFADDRLSHGQHADEFGTYLGQFDIVNGRPVSHGKGMLQFTNGDIYDGSWKHGQFHGQGCYIYAKNKDDEEAGYA
jgi:hypothetical protein